MTNTSRAIGITMGDPAGVGPEIICKALAEMSAQDRGSIRVFGNRSSLEAAAGIVGADLTFGEGEAASGAVIVENVAIELSLIHI